MLTSSFLFLTSLAVFYPAPRDPAPDEKGRGFFGIQLIDDGGVSITSVVPGSPAEKAGIRANDQIVAIDSQKVPSVNEAREVIGRMRPGKVAVVEVQRGNRIVTLRVVVGLRPDSAP